MSDISPLIEAQRETQASAAGVRSRHVRATAADAGRDLYGACGMPRDGDLHPLVIRVVGVGLVDVTWGPVDVVTPGGQEFIERQAMAAVRDVAGPARLAA